MIGTLHIAATHPNLFGAFGVDPKRCRRLSSDFIPRLRRLNHIFIRLGLFLRAHEHLTAIDNDMHVRAPAIVGTLVITNDDRAIRPHYHGRSISHVDARAPIGLRLDRVTGIELQFAARGHSLPGRGAKHSHISFY